MADLQLASTPSTSIYTNCEDYWYEIFINHRGPDVKNTFASHLYYSLRSHGLKPFLDREELQAGEFLSPQIEAAIKTASIHIAIFSPGYADSKWCLDELLLMLKHSGDIIIPVFYNVKPSDLRWTGRYVEALSNHEQKGRYDRYTLEKWRKALSSVSYIIGFELETYNGDEGKLLDQVVGCVLKKGRNIGLNVRYPTSLEEKVEDFEITVSLQDRRNGKVKVMGSVGMGGLDKTSRARNVFKGESSNFASAGTQGARGFSQSCIVGHRQLEKGTPISKDLENVIFQRETLLAATENFRDDKGSDLIFEGGEGNLKGSTEFSFIPKGFKLRYWMRRFIQRCNLKPLHMIENSADRQTFPESDDAVIFKWKTLLDATQNFDQIGQGGFGAVYKGTIQNGREIAVKKLSASSKQGQSEFLAEVKVLTKIQHGNLVNLLGCCAEGSTLMLVYEYLLNKSLDRILFDPNRRQKLYWEKRYNIIVGIARGLLYLHEECLPPIIHRDIKASNILLDEELNPKIADFGLAKVLQDETNVFTRVHGTMGYIAPEYVMQGQLSVKVDVFSFGILLLELVAGRKNIDFNLSSEMEMLLAWAWRSYRQENMEQLIDPSIIETCDKQQAMRCIHVALLCTQANPSLRPPMHSTTLMLSSPSVKLPDPTESPFTSSSTQYLKLPDPTEHIFSSSFGTENAKSISSGYGLSYF